MTSGNVFEAINQFSDGKKVFLEYGTGQSTIQAVENGLLTISVETDWQYFLKIIERLEPFIQKQQFWGFYCDIGPVKKWGYPSDDLADPKFLRYSYFPWVQAGRMSVEPDLILIDGRFRVASFVTSYQRANPGTIILFNNYHTRPWYHVVEKIAGPIFRLGDLAVFRVTEIGKKEFSDEKLFTLVQHFMDPR